LRSQQVTALPKSKRENGPHCSILTASAEC
jgi:hypothetical protein